MQTPPYTRPYLPVKLSPVSRDLTLHLLPAMTYTVVMAYTYPYPRPMVTADAVVFAVQDERLSVLAIRRKNEPYAGRWALPGGFVDMDESLETAVMRELQEETGVTGVRLEQMHTFSAPDRDPRGRSISTAFLGLTDWRRHTVQAADDAADAAWLPLNALPDMAFDHGAIVAYAVRALRDRLAHTAVGVEVLPERFTLGALRRLHETILGEKLDPRAFRRRVSVLGIIEPAPDTTAHRPRLYRFTTAGDAAL